MITITREFTYFQDGLVGQQVRDAIRKAKLQREVLRQRQATLKPATKSSSQKSAKASAEAQAEARYKVVSQKRAINLESLDEEAVGDSTSEALKQEEKNVRLLDLVTESFMTDVSAQLLVIITQ